jgi:hypothetical protein
LRLSANAQPQAAGKEYHAGAWRVIPGTRSKVCVALRPDENG